MKKGIFIAMAALALAVFAAPEAQSKSGPDVNQQFSGSTFIIDVDDAPDTGTGNSTAMLNAIAKGQPGTAHLDSIAVFGPLGAGVDGCNGQLGANVISQSSVERFSDGSLLTLSTTGGVICTPDGVVFTASVFGEITGGTKRFKNAGGTFRADVTTENSGLTGTLTADLN